MSPIRVLPNDEVQAAVEAALSELDRHYFDVERFVDLFTTASTGEQPVNNMGGEKLLALTIAASLATNAIEVTVINIGRRVLRAVIAFDRDSLKIAAVERTLPLVRRFHVGSQR